MMEQSEQQSMMESISKNIQGFELCPEPMHASIRGSVFRLEHPVRPPLVLKVLYKAHAANYKLQKKIHCALKNRFIVRLENCFEDQTCCYLVMEHCKGGNLRSLITASMSQERVRQLALQIIKGVHYLHKNGVVHHNLSPDNVLVTAQGELKICDFGKAARFEEGKGLKGCEGTLPYAPPEAIELHNEKYDVWSLGCMIYQMATGSPPFSFQTWKELTLALNETFLKNFSFKAGLSAPLLHLFKRIFVLDKKDRLSIDQVLKHPFFSGQSLPQAKREEERPLSVRARSKESVSSAKLREKSKNNKENLALLNTKVVARKGAMPNYKEILDKKFKKNEGTTEHSKPSSREKQVSVKTASEGFRETQQHLQTAPLSRTEQLGTRTVPLSPLNTRGMRINPLKVKNAEIRVDSEGFTRETIGKQQARQLINISPSGKTIRMLKGSKTKCFKLQALPKNYYRQYQECKAMLAEIQAEQVQLSVTDRVCVPFSTVEMSIMFDESVSVRLEGKVVLKKARAEEFLSNKGQIDGDLFNRLRQLYYKLVGLRGLG